MVIFHSYVSLPEGSQVGEHNSNFTRTYGRYIELVAMGLSTNVHITWQLGGHHLVGIPPTRNATHWVLLSLIWETPEREKTLQF